MTWAALANAHREALTNRPDLPVTGEEAIDEAVQALGRPLTPTETFNVRAGLPPDYRPHEPGPRPDAPRPVEAPEAAFARLARE